MADIKWIKIATDIFDDEKILLIESMPDADSLIVIWLKLLVLAGKCNSSGCLLMNDVVPYSEEMLSAIFRRPLNTVRLAINTFEKFGMVEVVNDVITIPKWEKHQSIEGMDKVREQNRERTRRYRERQKQKLLCDVTCNASVTHGNALEQEQERDKELEKRSSQRATKSILSLMTEDEASKLFSLYEDADLLVDAIDEELKLKDKFKEVRNAYRYVVGYATNKGWQTR